MNFIRRIILFLIVNAVAIFALDYFFEEICFTVKPECVNVAANNILAFVITGIFLGLANVLLKPILKLISLPAIFVSMGAFFVVINAVILFIVKFLTNILGPAFGIEMQVMGGFTTYILAALVIGAVNTVLHWLIKN